MSGLHSIRNSGASMVCFIVHIVEQKQRGTDGKQRWVQVGDPHYTHPAAVASLSYWRVDCLPLRIRPVLAELGR